ncbi:MAG: hypothetical protein HY815_25150 [Candidatus Riflebacteria bacterium]|nr:hypothetical protein [Candidatus Riflebacteria bacterium]
MDALKARVMNGRFVIETPAPFPDGTEIKLQIVDEGDELDEEEQAALDAELTKAWSEAKAGKSRPIDELLSMLQKAR